MLMILLMILFFLRRCRRDGHMAPLEPHRVRLPSPSIHPPTSPQANPSLFRLYPVTSQPIYLVSAPFFKALDIRLGTTDPSKPAWESKTYLKIRAPNLTAENICTSFYHPSASPPPSLPPKLHRAFLSAREMEY